VYNDSLFDAKKENLVPRNQMWARRISLVVAVLIGCLTTAFAQTGGVLTTPAPGSTLTGSSVTFQWTAGSAATAYWLDVGNVAGGNQYYQSGNLGNVLATSVSSLPTDGSTIYVTLYSMINGEWEGNAYTYTAFNAAAGLAVMQVPAPFSTLSGSSVTFQWTAGSAATAYWLDIGNVAGGNQYYQSGNLGNVLATTASGLPTNGSTVYVTLYSLVGGQWLSNSYTYTALSAAGGVLTTPAPGSTLTSGTVTFNWTAGAGASAYWLDIGSVSGGNQYYQSGNLGNVLTTTVSGLPTNGNMLFVTLYSMIGGQWAGNAYTYMAFNANAGLAAMESPTQGSTLSGSSVTFQWSAGTDATAYWLDAGNVAGGNQYYQSGNLGTAQTTTVSGLPTNGSTVYVTLYSMIGGQWSGNPYTYTAFNANTELAAMQSPTQGSMLSGSSVTFQWSAGTGATAYWLDVGNVAGGNQYYQSGNLGTAQTTTVSGLPTNGSTVYATLYSLIGGQWLSNAYSYMAFNATTATAAVLTTPTPGSTLTSSSVTFTWTAGTGASAYWLDIGNAPGGNTYYQSGNLGSVLSTTASGLPTNGSTVYVTLYSMIGGQWVNNQYTYTALNGRFTLVQHVHNTACTGATTCAITLDQGIAAGDLLIFESSTYDSNTAFDTSFITATDNGGTFVQCVSCVGADPTSALEGTSGGWILSASAEASAITVTFSVPSTGEIEMWEYSYTGGTPGFDGANQNETVNSSSPTAHAFTASGSNDISVQACRSDWYCDSVSSPFTDDHAGNLFDWAHLDNVTSWTAPTWTLANSGFAPSPTSQLTQMEFGFNVSPCANTTFVDFGGTNGSTVSEAQLASGTHGWQGGYWTINTGGAQVSGTPYLTFETAASQTLQNPTGRLCDGGNYTDSSTTGLEYSTAEPATFLQINATGGALTGTSVSAGAWYYSTLPGTGDFTAGTDDLAIFGSLGQDYVLLHEFNYDGGRLGEIECGSAVSTGNVVLARSTWYWVEIVYNTTGNHTMKIYNDADPPVQVGSTMTCPSKGTVQPAYITIGNANQDPSLPSGYLFYYDGLKISLDGTDPLLP
jgi:hypothetical protein